MKYLIVLFKNKKRKKILNKFKTLERANKYFNDTLKTSNNILFSKSFNMDSYAFFDRVESKSKR